MEDLMARIEKLSDSQLVEVMNEVHAKLFSSVDYNEMMAAAAASEASDMQYLVNLDAQSKASQKDVEEAGGAMRALLGYMAADSDYAHVVADAVDEVTSHEQLSIVAAIIAVGLMVNLTILVSTTKIKYEDGRISVIKEVAPTDLIREVMSPVKVLAEHA